MLSYTSEGDPARPVVVWLHGFMGSSADWRPVVAALGGEYRCLAVDLPGHGASVGLAEEVYSMEGAARGIEEVLRAEAVERCAVVGYSMGGRAALYFAVHRPERCRRLVLESASPGLPDEAERASRRAQDEARSLEIEDDLEAFLETWYRQPLFATLAEHEGLVEAMVRSRRANDPAELARALRGLGTGRQPSLWERLASLRVSTLALAGARDGKYVETAEQMGVLNPNIRTAIIPDAGHNVHAEHPEVFLDVVRDFLRRP